MSWKKNVAYKKKLVWQNATGILLKNASKVYEKMRQIFYYRMRQVYCKMWQLFQNVTLISKCDDFIRKCNNYYNPKWFGTLWTVEKTLIVLCQVFHCFLRIFHRFLTSIFNVSFIRAFLGKFLLGFCIIFRRVSYHFKQQVVFVTNWGNSDCFLWY